jgi:hypothetical protein
MKTIYWAMLGIVSMVSEAGVLYFVLHVASICQFVAVQANKYAF